MIMDVVVWCEFVKKNSMCVVGYICKNGLFFMLIVYYVMDGDDICFLIMWKC